MLKEDLAGGRLPSGLFGANAAWWAIAVLAFNLNSALKHLVLGGEWVRRRFKAVRFGLIGIAGRVVYHARSLIIRLAKETSFVRPAAHDSPKGLVAQSRTTNTVGDLPHNPPVIEYSTNQRNAAPSFHPNRH